MKELLEQIEELCKGLLSPKPKQDFFVPAIKSPTLKPPKMSMGGVSVGKIPGQLPPPSKKDPKKMAEQLKNPNPGKANVEVLKVESNGQWRLEKSQLGVASSMPKPPGVPKTTMPAPAVPAQPKASLPQATIDSGIHGWGEQHHTPAQNQLIHGIHLGSSTPVGKGLQGARWASRENSTEPHAIVKNSMDHEYRDLAGHIKDNFNSAKREVLFHNMAHNFFGMGQHVPTTAGFTVNGQDWSAQNKIHNATSPHVEESATRPAADPNQPQRASQQYSVKDDNHRQILNKLHNNGTLDKLRLMDHIMGNHDRHGGNFLLDNKGDGLHLIDNGASFDYGNAFGTPDPYYSKLGNLPSVKGRRGYDSEKQLHPEALKWLNDLDENKAQELFAKQGYSPDSYASQGFVNRLRGIKEELANGGHPDVNSALKLNRAKTRKQNV